MTKKTKTHFVCTDCGTESVKWLGRCPGCNAWGTMAEEVVSSTVTLPSGLTASVPLRLRDIEMTSIERFSTGSAEFDRVLGGGVIPGSLVLVGGDPGIGKSTLLLQTANRVALAGGVVLYVTGEESPQQVRLRATRLGAFCDELLVLAETDLDQIEKHVREQNPILLIIDSIQTVFRQGLSSAPGSAQQVRECTLKLLQIAKDLHIATCIVGHVTKDGTIAGPRRMEPMVDAVLLFEGEPPYPFWHLPGGQKPVWLDK